MARGFLRLAVGVQLTWHSAAYQHGFQLPRRVAPAKRLMRLNESVFSPVQSSLSPAIFHLPDEVALWQELGATFCGDDGSFGRIRSFTIGTWLAST
jgi:hypothetical protein